MAGMSYNMINDYCVGIAYGTRYFVNDEKGSYLVVRNLDKWYVENIAEATGYKAYESANNIERDKKKQWVVKARNIHTLPSMSDIQCKKDFCRAYIELHGTIDVRVTKSMYKPRLRVYGKEKIISFINNILPAKEKKIQYIKNRVNEKYIGETCAIYYQSKVEILEILQWIDGQLKNEKVWGKWNDIMKNY